MSQRLRTVLLVVLLTTLLGLGGQLSVAAPPPPTLYVSVFGNDSGACTSPGAGACATVQAAVTKAAAGATIMVEAGTYTGQVSIGKSLTLTGAGEALTTLQAPATLNPPTLLTLASGQTTIIEIADGATVTLSGLTVSGPGPGPCGSLTYGIFVGEAATLNISQAVISDIRDQPLGGCQNGIGIRAGSQGLGHVATLNATNITLSAYQKGGIVVDGPGSSGLIDGVQALGVGPHPIIAQNGIQISRGATATVKNNSVSGHECNNTAGSCGPDPLTQAQSAGILLYQPGAVTIQNNTVQTNDVGILNYASSGTITADANTLTDNRYEGVFHNDGTLNFTRNTVSGGNIGFFNGSFDGDSANTTATLTNNFINTTVQKAIWNFDEGFSLTSVGPNRPPSGIVCCGEPPYKPKRDKVETDSFVPVLTANNNHLASNPVGLVNQSGQAVNAENNWWGSVNGPTHAGNSVGVGSQGVTITGANVDYVPWLTSGVDSDVPQPGFQPGAGTSLTPVTTTNPVGQYASIQAGVNASNPGGSVIAAAVTFVENVTVNKQVTVLGAQANVLAKGRPGPESVIKPANLAGVTVDIQSDGVTVNGFKLDGTGVTSPWLITAINGAGADGRFTDLKVLYNQFVGNPGNNSNPGGMYLYATDNAQIEGNYFNDLGQHAVFLAGGSNNAVYRNNDSFGNYNSNLSTQDTDHNNLLAENNRADQDDMILFKLKNATIRNNTFTSSASASGRVYLGGGDDGVLVEGNTFNGVRSQAVIAFDAGFGYGQTRNITIKGNTVTTGVDMLTANNSVFDLRSVGGTTLVTENLITVTSSSFPGGATAIYGVGVRGSGTGTVTISKNELNGGGIASTGTPPSSGILLRTNDSTYGALPATAVVNIANNIITGFVNGVSVYNVVGAAYGGLPTGADVNVNQNSLAGNSANGLRSGTGELIDAEQNWWGSANGPTHPANTFNVGAQGVGAAGNLDFTPWLTDGTDTQPATRGFQPNLTTFAPITNNEGESYSNFADAIAGTNAGGVITAAAGTYTEAVTVNKQVTLRGAQYAVDGRTRCDATSGETIMNSPHGGFYVTANMVVITGFVIENGSNAAQAPYGYGIYLPGNFSGYGVRNNVLRNNIVGLYLNSEGTFETQVQFNCFKANNQTGAANGSGIYSDQGLHNAWVDSNLFTSHDNTSLLLTGTAPDAVSTVVVSNNQADNRLLVMYATNTVVNNNTITNSTTHGVQLGGGNHDVTVRDNLIQNGSASNCSGPCSGIRFNDITGVTGGAPNTNITILSNAILGNGYGIRIADDSISGTIAVHFNRIVGNTTQGLENLETAITVDAENNWWGCNYGPGATGPGCLTAPNGVTGPVDADPWLTLTLSASPTTVEVGGNATATGSLTVNSASADTGGAGYVPNGTPMSFSAAYGSMSPTSTTTTSGKATSTFTAGQATGVNPYTVAVDGQTVTRTLTVRAGTATKPAIVRGNALYLRNSLDNGPADYVFLYGAPTDTFLMCDWNGDGVKTVGVFRDGAWFLKDTNAGGTPDVVFTFGMAGDMPLCGDWDGNGTDTVGVARATGGFLYFYLRNANASGTPDLSFGYGLAGDTPVVGDWDGDGDTTIGVKRANNWFLRNTNDTGDANMTATYGIPSDIPVIGDWDNNNTETLGVFRDGAWFLRNSNDNGIADFVFSYGLTGDQPLPWK